MVSQWPDTEVLRHAVQVIGCRETGGNQIGSEIRMRQTITRIHPAMRIVGADGRMMEVLRLFLLGVELNGIMIGDGTPETYVEAQQGQLYMDETATAGVDPVVYIKQKADIGGDKKQGWVAI